MFNGKRFLTPNENQNISFNNNIFKAIILGIVFLVIQSIIYYLLKCLNEPLTKAYDIILSKGKFRIVLFSTIFGVINLGNNHINKNMKIIIKISLTSSPFIDIPLLSSIKNSPFS